MKGQQTLQISPTKPLKWLAVLCLAGTFNLHAAGEINPALHMLDSDVYRSDLEHAENGRKASTRVHPGTPLALAPANGGFEFDLGGSDIPKLQLELAQPLQLQPGNQVRHATQSDLLGLDATLTMPLGSDFAVHGRAEQSQLISPYQALGSIQCMNGTLGPQSYTASGCRFVNDSTPTFDRRTLSLGASRDFGSVSTSINWFTSQSGNHQAGISPHSSLMRAPVLDPLPISSASLQGILPGMTASSFAGSEASGVDLNFQVGFTTDRAGEVQLGLALTRVYDASLNGLNGETFTPLAWNTAEPFHAAALGIEWSKGSFSSGVRGYYREPVSFLDRQNLDSIGTFDVHFTWRTPWNANFSVGASNVLGAGVDDSRTPDKPASADRFESIYGRIPYVRYQQDL
jgi:hypothetical protein